MLLRRCAATLVLAAFCGSASAQEPSPFGFESPFLYGDLDRDPWITIDLGGDGVTDLLFSGDVLLNGSERIPTEATDVIHSVTRGMDGRWRHAQTFPGLSGYPNEYSVTGDVDGDGAQDVVLNEALPTEGHTWRRPFGLELLHQDPLGSLHRAGAAFVDSSADYPQVHIVGDGSGRVLHLTRPESDTYGALTGIMMRWRADSGWTRLWSAAPDSLVQSGWRSGYTAIVGRDDPMMVGYAVNYGHPRHYGIAVPIRNDGFGPSKPFDIPRNGRFVELDRQGERQVWLWSRDRPDSLYQIVKVASVDAVRARATAIEGVPADMHLELVDALATPGSDAYFLFAGENSEVVLVGLTPEGAARQVARWTGPRLNPLRLMLAPNGAVEILWWWSYSGNIILPAGVPQGELPPDLPMHISSVTASVDVDRDGRIDLLVEGEVGGVVGLWLLRGMNRAPWFRPPEPVGPKRSGSWEHYGTLEEDLDGDGQRDLVRLYLDTSNGQAMVLTTWFWDGWRYDHDPSSDVTLANLEHWLPGDFDGDGRGDFVVATRDSMRWKLALLRWNPDRTPVAPRGIENLSLVTNYLWGAGDIDRDGRSEVLAGGYRSISAWRIDPTTGSAASLGSWSLPTDYTSGGLADLTGDGMIDLYMFGSYDTWVWSVDKPDPLSFTPLRIPIVPYAWLGADADVDADGRVDFASRGSPVLETVTDPLGEARHRAWILPEGLRGIELHDTVWSDVDRDGDPDLVTACEDGIRVHLNGTLRPSVPDERTSMIHLIGSNPARGEARVAVHAARAGDIHLELFDVSGRRVWSAVRKAGGEGWVDARVTPTVSGAVAPAGVYFLRAEASGRVETQRIVLGR